MRKSANRKVRLNRAPVTSALANEIRMGLHSALVVLRTKFASVETLEQLQEGIDMVGFSVEGNPKFKDEAVLLNSGSLALRALANRGLPISVTPYEYVPIETAVNTVDAMLPRLDTTRLYLALQRVRAVAESK
jgi:hypothetical protein